MASKKDTSTPDQGRLKIRFFEFEVEGGNSTLMESVKSVAAAINRGNGAAHTVRALPRSDGNGDAQMNAGVDEDDGDINDPETIEQEVPAAPRKSAAPRKRPPLNLVHGIDWTTAPSLKDFVAELDLDSSVRKYTAIANWFKEHRNTPAITVHHMYSAYKHLGWTLPKYPVDTLQDLKNKREYKWMDGTSVAGEYAINAYGDQEVAKWRKGAS